MGPEVHGERWVQSQLAVARPAFERGDPELAFASIAEYEASLRQQVAAFLAPVDAYLGMTLASARQRAQAMSERLCVHPTGHRANLSPVRVHVRMEAGFVVVARRDRPGWLKTGPEPQW